MEHTTLERLERIPMSWEEFDALPEGVRAEYVDGVAIVSPAARGRHQDVAMNLTFVLHQALPGATVRLEAGFHLRSGSHRIPDVSVQRVRDDEYWSDESPVLLAEVLSPSTRREDIFHKSDDYRLAGVEQYWIVDREAGELTIRRNAGEEWETILELDEKTPRGEATVADLGTVALDLEQLLS